MTHECKTKVSPLIELLINSYGNLYCHGCWKYVFDEDVDKVELERINKKFRNRE